MITLIIGIVLVLAGIGLSLRIRYLVKQGRLSEEGRSFDRRYGWMMAMSILGAALIIFQLVFFGMPFLA